MSSPNVHDKNTQNVMYAPWEVAAAWPHYKSGVCVSHAREFFFDENDECVGEHVYAACVPCVLPQHLAALPIVML